MKRIIAVLIFLITILLSGIFTIDNGIYMAKKDDIKEEYSENLAGGYDSDFVFLMLQKNEGEDTYKASIFSRSIFIDRFLLSNQVDNIKLDNNSEMSIIAVTQNENHEFTIMEDNFSNIKILHTYTGNHGIIKRFCYLTVLVGAIVFVHIKNKKK